jgi:hypothetical protein
MPMTVQERIELLSFIKRVLPTLADHALYSVGLACTALAYNGEDEDAETPRKTFEYVLDMLNDPNTRALGTIACAMANAQTAAQRSDNAVYDLVARHIRRSEM